MMTHNKGPAKPVKNRPISWLLRTIYLLLAAFYFLISSWAGAESFYESLPVFFVAASLLIAGLMPTSAATSRGGIAMIATTGVVGLLACLVDVYRLYKDPNYSFDGITILIFVITAVFLTIFVFASMDTYQARNDYKVANNHVD